jgi:phage tail-like protein
MSTKSTNISRFSSIATDPLRNFKFYAEFRPAFKNGAASGVFDSAITTAIGGFTSINGLSINTQSIPYREGGYNTTIHQIPGMTTFSPVTFQRGTLTGTTQGLKWMRGLFAAASGEGLAVGANKDFRVDVDIYILDHPAHIDEKLDLETIAKMQFRIHNAWITTLSYSDLNAGDQNILFEQMTLVHEGLSVGFVGGDTALTQY